MHIRVLFLGLPRNQSGRFNVYSVFNSCLEAELLPSHRANPALVYVAFLLGLLVPGCAALPVAAPVRESPTSTPIAPATSATSTALGGFPFPVGTTWAYSRVEYEQVIGDPTRIITATGLYTDTIVSVEGTAPSIRFTQDRTVGNIHMPLGWWSSTILNPEQHSYRIEGDQVFELRSLNNAEDLIYDFPLQVDKRWCVQPLQPPNASGCNDMGRREVQGQESIATPAGTFADCFKILDLYYTGDVEWFCNGVGIVARRYDHAGTRFGFADTLIRFSIGPSPP